MMKCLSGAADRLSGSCYFQVMSLVTACWLTVGLAIPAQAQSKDDSSVRATQTEIFVTRLPTIELFPECGAQGSPSCEYRLVVIARSRVDTLKAIRGSYAEFSMLPTPLLSSVLFDLHTNPEECPAEKLAMDLKMAQKKSLELNEYVFATITSDETFGCFGIVAAATKPNLKTILLWQAGEIRGWLDCQTGVAQRTFCTAEFQSKVIFSEQFTDMGLQISGIAGKALKSFLQSMGQIEDRIFGLMSKRADLIVSESFPRNEVYLDEATQLFLDNLEYNK